MTSDPINSSTSLDRGKSAVSPSQNISIFFAGRKSMGKAILMLIVFLTAGVCHAAIIYNDGGTHTIDSYINDSVEVWDGPSDITTLNIVDNAIIQQSVYSAENSVVTISGGEIVGSISSSHNSTFIVEGGEIGNMIFANHYSQIYIYGSDFKINDVEVDYGEIGVRSGLLTGTLSNSDLINNMFDIGADASVFLVPEPSTLCLLAFGSFLLRKTLKE